MVVERLRPTTFQLTLGAFELAALVAAARWVTGGAEGELTAEARDQLRGVLASYDEQWKRLNAARDAA
jgi:hypothetical protein